MLKVFITAQGLVCARQEAKPPRLKRPTGDKVNITGCEAAFERFNRAGKCCNVGRIIKRALATGFQEGVRVGKVISDLLSRQRPAAIARDCLDGGQQAN